MNKHREISVSFLLKPLQEGLPSDQVKHTFCPATGLSSRTGSVSSDVKSLISDLKSPLVYFIMCRHTSMVSVLVPGIDTRQRETITGEKEPMRVDRDQNPVCDTGGGVTSSEGGVSIGGLRLRVDEGTTRRAEGKASGHQSRVETLVASMKVKSSREAGWCTTLRSLLTQGHYPSFTPLGPPGQPSMEYTHQNRSSNMLVYP